MGRRRAKTETEEEKMQKCRQSRPRDKEEERGNMRAGTGQGKGITQDSGNRTQDRERDPGQRQQAHDLRAEVTRERITDCPEGTYIGPEE